MNKTINAINRAWCAETGAGDAGRPRSPRGQCAVTALLVQDLLGGDLLRAVVKVTDIGVEESHYWNLIPGIGEVDLTRAQYAPDQIIPRGEVVPRSRLLEGERAEKARTRERYEKLRSNFMDAVG